MKGILEKMEDGVFSWAFLVVMFYGPGVYWCVKSIKAERKARREEYWSRW